MQHIALIGHGEMLFQCAERLGSAGFEVSTYEISAKRSKAQIKAIAKTVSGADLIITLLENPQEVEEVFLGENGILQAANAGSFIIDLSLNTPQFARELHALAMVHDCYFVEAPFIIDDAFVRGGSIRLFVGGEAAVIEQLRPILDTLSSQALVVGLPGTGASARLAETISFAAALMSLAETLTFLLNSKVDVASIPMLLDANPHITPLMEQLAQNVLEEQFESGTPIEPFFKELSEAIDAADELELAFPVLDTAHQLYDLLMMVGGSRMALQALVLVYRDEEFCVSQGLDWGLAQRVMDVYDQANGFGYEPYDDDCDDPDCGHHHHHFSDDDDEFPEIDDYYSSN